jgi:hypothetical protein
MVVELFLSPENWGLHEGNDNRLSLAGRIITSSIGAADIIAQGFNPGI